VLLGFFERQPCGALEVDFLDAVPLASFLHASDELVKPWPGGFEQGLASAGGVAVARDLIELSGLRPELDVPIRITQLQRGEKLRQELIDTERGRTSCHPFREGENGER
jgi:hypothetical protein